MLKHLLLALSVICLTTTTLGFQVGDGPVTYTYKTVGNLSIQADVYVPKITVRGKHPVVLAIHGGGYVGGAKSGGCSGQELNEMLSRGWLVVSIDYRLAPYSHLADMVQDVQDAYAWIRTELVKIEPLDLDSFIVLGGSAGGGLAVISGYMLSPRPQAIIAFYPGCTNYTDAFDYNGTLPVPQSLVTQMEALMQPLAEYNMNGTDPRSVFFDNAVANEKTGWMISSNDPNIPVNTLIEYLQNYSAVYHIDSTYPPTVLIHGFDDTLVPHQQSVLMASYLKKANVPYRLNLVPGEGHAFDFGDISVQIWDDYILTAFNFAQKYLASSSPIDIYDIIQ